MTHRLLRFLVVPAVLCATLGQQACAQLPVAPAALSAAQTEQLLALNVPIAVPAYVPPGFAVASVRADAGSEDEGPEAPLDRSPYEVRYANDAGACFAIETATGGLGGPVPERRRVLHPAAFPAPTDEPAYLYWTGRAPEPGFRPHSLFSDWMGGPPLFYRLASGGSVPENCAPLAPDVAARVAESLRFVDAPGDDAPGDDAPGDAIDVAAYDLYLLNRPFAIQSEKGASPRAAALHVLEELSLGSVTAKSVRVVGTARGTVDVLATYVGLRDDSIAGKRHLVRMERTDGRWVLILVGSQVTCQPGRGHPSWSSEPCL